MRQFIKAHKMVSIVGAAILALLVVIGGGFVVSYVVAIAIGAA